MCVKVPKNGQKEVKKIYQLFVFFQDIVRFYNEKVKVLTVDIRRT